MSEAHSIDSLSDEAFGWYLSGLTDGEGTFVICRRDKSKPRNGWQTRFAIGMRDDESSNLRAIGRRMRCGIFARRQSKAQARQGFHPTLDWVVVRLDDLAGIIIPHFERYPLQMKKSRDFAIWREGVLFLKQVRGQRPKHSRRVLSTEEDAFVEGVVARLKAAREYAPVSMTGGVVMGPPVAQS